MPAEPAISGEITTEGVLEILRDIESRRITGYLRFTETTERGAVQTGEVELIAGQIAMDQDALPDGSDPVERLLALRGGHYVVHQRLPPLPITHGDEHERTGSLAVHVPADLMNYCEQNGLTGTLTLARDGEQVELVYEFGELLAIRVDGREESDVSHAFAWEDGSFRLATNTRARTLVPEVEDAPEDDDDPASREPTTQFVRPRADETGRAFLKVMEVALTTIVDQRDKARPATRTSPSVAPHKTVRPRPPTMPAPAPPRRREPTVRVVYLRPDDPRTAIRATDLSTRHAAGRPQSASEDALPARREEALLDASPARRTPEPLPAITAPVVAASSLRPTSEPAPAPSAAPTGDRASRPDRTSKPDRTPLPGSSTPEYSPRISRPSGQLRAASRPKSDVAPLVWVIAVIAIGLFVIGLLSQLPGPR